jgi:hypothetical protein
LNPNGTNRFKDNRSDNCKGYGNDPEYLTARIARDRPDKIKPIRTAGDGLTELNCTSTHIVTQAYTFSKEDSGCGFASIANDGGIPFDTYPRYKISSQHERHINIQDSR